MPVMTPSDLHAWWFDLRHRGLVVAPALLDEQFPLGPIKPGDISYQRLREHYAAFDTWYRNPRAYEEGVNRAPLNDWLEWVFEHFLGHPGSRWQSGNRVQEQWKHRPFSGEALIPRRVLFRDDSQRFPELFVWVEPVRELMHGRGRAAYGKLLSLLRAKQVKLGLLTNGRHFRLCYAGIDHDSWVEWDCDQWFQEEELRRQLYGFYTLLGPSGMNPREAGELSFPLLAAAEGSRTRQSDLSVVMGEQIRQAVEMLLNDMHRAIHLDDKVDQDGLVHNKWLGKVSVPPNGKILSERRMLDALYQAAVRVIMRMVIVFFAEARDMLPLSLAPYALSYSLEGLYEQLRRAAQHHGRDALDEQFSAWTRMLSLFTLIYEGSLSPDLSVPEYGGLLFRSGDFDSPDAVQRAVALFESFEISQEISDATVLRLLQLLKVGKLKIRQGRTSRMVSGPVDFSELRTEYIGLMYQGLLDFNLHMANEPMIFLELGQEPLLPLSTLEKMPESHLKELLKKLREEKGSRLVVSEDSEEEDEAEEDALETEEDIEEPPVEEVEEDEDSFVEERGEVDAANDQDSLDEKEQLRRRVIIWARQAVEVAGFVKKPRNIQGDAVFRYEEQLANYAKKLIRKPVIDQGEFYLTRRGGTRKGSGTFYTRPQLAVPIARRTLQPLLYETQDDGTTTPRKPEDILAIKVCDPACGSGAFLVAALHYIAEALYESLLHHSRLKDVPQRGVHLDFRAKTLPLGKPSEARIEEHLIPLRADHEQFQATTIAYLRRYVVEECIYGVDLSPLAVELARMSLWIETMARSLPFTFLDHKIKVGNALVGGWFNSFQEYPIMAWKREGGDKSHRNGVHYQAEEWTREINKQRDETIKPQLIAQIKSTLPQLFSEYVLETPERLFREFTDELLRIHRLPIDAANEREERYRALRESVAFREMKFAFDRWCAAWFWPADKLDEAPTPEAFYQPASRTHEMIEELAENLRFFHWELEFLDVFNRPEHGFDAILANPPWETAKPYSKEFFSDYDLLYRTYGKQEALRVQRDLFQQEASVEREWLVYQANFKSMGNWAKYAASPFGDPEVRGIKGITLKGGRAEENPHLLWRRRRAQYEHFADQNEPFRYQGSADLNTYKMFLEVAHHLLKEHGRLGMLVPSGIYTDQGSAQLRKVFLNNCRWEWLFGFINNERIFEIHSAFKFAALIVEKNDDTKQMSVSFNRQQLSDFEHPDQYMFGFPRQQVERFSPRSLAIVELQAERDREILEKLYTGTVLLGSQGTNSWEIQYATEFHMTNDSKLFPPLPEWDVKGYRADGYGRWVDKDDNVALPLYEGRMISAFDPCEKGWRSGKGRGADWGEPISFDSKKLKPQYLVSYKAAQERIGNLGINKISFMSIGSATNARSMYASVIDNFPCGHSISIFRIASKLLPDLLAFCAILNSFTYDYALRSRLGGLNLSSFVLEETPLIPPSRLIPTSCAQLAARLNFIMPGFAPQWLEMRKAYLHLGDMHWRGLWAITPHERLRLRCILDAIIAELYGLGYDDFEWILRAEPLDNLKGFWRIDQKKPKELRHTTLALKAFERLKEVGLEAFCQEDWQFPAEIAMQLGERFTPWQKEGSVEDSWEECEMHAQRMKETPIPLPEEKSAKRNSTDGSQNSKNSTRGKDNQQAPLAQQLDLWNTQSS